MGRITIRLSDDFINKLKEEAQKNELTLSDMVRVKLTEKNKINKRNNQQLVYELNRIGLNLNQIAKHCNSKKIVDKLVLEELIVIEKQLQEITNDM
jgi:FMN-dependent NADH-azoreductase